MAIANIAKPQRLALALEVKTSSEKPFFIGSKLRLNVALITASIGVFTILVTTAYEMAKEPNLVAYGIQESVLETALNVLETKLETTLLILEQHEIFSDLIL